MTTGMTVLFIVLILICLSEWLYGNHLARTTAKYSDCVRRNRIRGRFPVTIGWGIIIVQIL